MEQFGSGLTLFLSLLVEAIPFLILGVVVSGLLLIFINEQKLIAILPRNPLMGALVGSLIGFLFPVCECGNVPVARRLLSKGVSAPVAIGFLLAAPTINPVVVWATWTAFRDQPEIVVLRMIFSFTIATIVGWVFSIQGGNLKPFLQPAVAMALPAPPLPTSEASDLPDLLKSGTFILDQPGKPLQLDSPEFQSQALAAPPLSLNSRLQMLLDNTLQELRELGGVLVLGSLIATIIQVAVPREIILGLGQGPVSSVLAMMTLGGVISICSTVDSFFALSFASTFTSGAILAFLVFGPMFDLKSMGLMLTVFKARTVFYIFGLVTLLTLLFTLFINLWIS